MTVVYDDGQSVVHHGDCFDLVDVWARPGAAVLLVTDPPYGRNWRQGVLRKKRSRSDGAVGIAGDSSTDTRDRALAAWGDRPAVVFGDLMLPPPAGTRQVCVYAKPPDAGARGATAGVRRDVEAIYLVGRWPTGIAGGRGSVFGTRSHILAGASGPVTRYQHPHAKPVDMLEDLISMVAGSLPVWPELVVDPFAGSGSVLVSARNLGIRAVGVEVVERHCRTAAGRLAQTPLSFPRERKASPVDQQLVAES